MYQEGKFQVNSYAGLIFRPERPSFFSRLKKKKWYFFIPAIFVLTFILINTDINSLKYFFWSRVSSKSVRNMEVSDAWLKKYNIVVNDKMSILDDSDGDGMNFQEEMTYKTNPFSADSDQDGINDSEEIKNGMNPLGSGELDNDGDKMPDKWEKESGLLANVDDSQEDADGDGLKNIDEYIYGTNPKDADSDQDGFSDFSEIQNGYDPSAPGDIRPKVVILFSRIDVAAPMVWSESEDTKSLEKDLENGVIRFPKSGVPGQNGNIIISGHSSNYAWAKGEYNSIFKNFGHLEKDDAVIFRVIQKNGKTFDYEYKIMEKRVVSPDDNWIFENFDNQQMATLSTCWPIGTDISRMVIRAERA